MIITEKIEAVENKKVVLDPKGFFVIFLDRRENKIIIEQYENVYKDGKNLVRSGKLGKIIVGDNSQAIIDTLVRENLISRLDHAGYLGRELMKAEIALKNGLKYEQAKDLTFEES